MAYRREPPQNPVEVVHDGDVVVAERGEPLAWTLIGADRVLNGSDYPHPEGLEWPVEFVNELEGLGDADVRRVMRDNFADLVA